MATLSNRNGVRYVQLVDRRGDRQTLSLGRIGKAPAEEIRGHVSALERAALTNTAAPRKTAEWLGELGDQMYVKLAALNLVVSREVRASADLGPFLDGYIAKRTDLKERTVTNLKQARALLVAFFGARRDLATINKGEAKDWHRGLLRTLATATVATHVKKARQFFDDAADRGLIEANPFRGIKAGSQVNADRQKFVQSADVLRVMDECPDAEWRVIFALARFGGLRVPSETSLLRWSDVDFARGRMNVRSPKTEHHQGKAEREVPIFPELLPWLLEARDAAEEDAVHVVTRHRGENLRTTTLKFVERAGLTAWPKLFQNMRSSRQTELEDDFPSHVVCAWLGNSERVARKHYLQVTDEHFERAARRAVERTGKDRKQMQETNEKPRIPAGSSQNQYPQGESNARPFSLGINGVKGPALRRALRRLRRASMTLYRHETAKMRTRKGGR